MKITAYVNDKVAVFKEESWTWNFTLNELRLGLVQGGTVTADSIRKGVDPWIATGPLYHGISGLNMGFFNSIEFDDPDHRVAVNEAFSGPVWFNILMSLYPCKVQDVLVINYEYNDARAA